MIVIALCVIIDIFVFVLIGAICYHHGHANGYDEGYTQGRTAGHADGYEKGEKVGYEKGREEGFADGKIYAAVQGHNEKVLTEMGLLPDNKQK